MQRHANCFSVCASSAVSALLNQSITCVEGELWMLKARKTRRKSSERERKDSVPAVFTSLTSQFDPANLLKASDKVN